MPTFLRIIVLAGIALASLSAAADELVLNGSGIRKRVIFEVYSIGLYLPKRVASAQEAIAAPGPKRIDIRMLRDVGAEQFSGALAEGIRENHSETEARALEPSVKQLISIMAEVQEAKKGMLVSLGWDGKATQLRIDGKSVGAPIEGEDFYRALLRIWLGEKPVQENLKKALLGAAQ